MKNILRKNQVIIASLAIMIMIAGYLNFTRGKLDESALNPDVQTGDILKGDVGTTGDLAQEELEITDEIEDVSNVDSENANAEVGEAVLANQVIGTDFFVSNKLKREQTRALSEATLKEIINNANIADAQKQSAIDQMIELTSIKEKETVTEALLEAKGFPESLVTITDGTVEVVVNANNLSEQQIAQIEDVVKRKTGITAKNIVISPINVLEESATTETATSEQVLQENAEDVTLDVDAEDTMSQDEPGVLEEIPGK